VNVGEIRARVQARFGDTSGAEVTSTDILRWINDGILEIARRTQQPQASAQTNTVIGQAGYSLSTFASDVLRLRKVMLGGTVLSGLSIEEADVLLPDREAANQGNGAPDRFWIWADTLNLFPAPDRVQALKLFYVKRPAAVAVDGDVPGIPTHMHTDLVDYVIAQAMDSTGDADRAERRMGRFEQTTREAASDAEWPIRGGYPHVVVDLEDVWF
jgi:hypothetical protein